MNNKAGFQVKKAARTQIHLASRLILEWSGNDPRYVGGVDCGYEPSGRYIIAAAVVFKFPDMDVIESAWSVDKLRIPYIPGFLSFREFFPCRKVLQKVRHIPDILFVDGNGIAHPRKMGLASHLGLLLDLSTVGCAKTSIFSSYLSPPEKRGEWTGYKHPSGERVGVCLRTRDKVKPIFVSPGHKMDIKTACRFSLLFSKFRIPEPLRLAHILAKKIASKEIPSIF